MIASVVTFVLECHLVGMEHETMEGKKGPLRISSALLSDT
jgi:hypothetical protein